MTDNVKLIFEVEDLRNASPATVSRAAVLFVSDTDLDWEPVLMGWLRSRASEHERAASVLEPLFGKLVGNCRGPKEFGHLFAFIDNACNPLVALSRVGRIEATLRLLAALLARAELSASEADRMDEVERLLLLCICWGVGGPLGSDDRTRLDAYLRERSTNMPPIGSNDSVDVHTVFDFNINLETMEWEAWAPSVWNYPGPQVEFSRLIVPTESSTSTAFLIRALHSQRAPLLLIGASGTGKTTIVESYLDSLDTDQVC